MFAGLCSVAGAQGGTVAFTNAHLIPVDGPEIERGTLVVRDGKIVAVGAANAVRPPSGATVIDATGRVIMPGLICTHSHIGGISGADRSGPIQPGVRVMDSLNVMDSGFKRAVAGGSRH